MCSSYYQLLEMYPAGTCPLYQICFNKDRTVTRSVLCGFVKVLSRPYVSHLQTSLPLVFIVQITESFISENSIQCEVKNMQMLPVLLLNLAFSLCSLLMGF